MMCVSLRSLGQQTGIDRIWHAILPFNHPALPKYGADDDDRT